MRTSSIYTFLLNLVKGLESTFNNLLDYLLSPGYAIAPAGLTAAPLFFINPSNVSHSPEYYARVERESTTRIHETQCCEVSPKELSFPLMWWAGKMLLQSHYPYFFWKENKPMPPVENWNVKELQTFQKRQIMFISKKAALVITSNGKTSRIVLVEDKTTKKGKRLVARTCKYFGDPLWIWNFREVKKISTHRFDISLEYPERSRIKKFTIDLRNI